MLSIEGHARAYDHDIFAYGNHAIDQRLCFRYIDSPITLLNSLNPKFQASSHLCACTARFVSDLVGNSEDRFSVKVMSWKQV